MNKAVFIDKDGTLIQNVPYNVDPDKVKLNSYAAEAIESFKANGFVVVVISNQSGVAWGYFEEDALKSINARIQELLLPANVAIDAFYYCPHHPDAQHERYAIKCSCRKPNPGMLLQAAVDLNIDLSLSWMIGDILHDVEAGNKAGCATILLDMGHETEWLTNEQRWPSYIVKNWEEAARIIVQNKANDYARRKIFGGH
jgi:histidinol-phosphate phosphatase family protein